VEPTAIAAIQTGRQYIGIDLVEKYVDLARAKIEAGTQIRLISERKAEQYAYQSPGLGQNLDRLEDIERFLCAW
jgi:DNA modification methylase